MEPGSTGNSGQQGRHHPPEQDHNQDGDQGIDEVAAPAAHRSIDGHSARGRSAGPVAEDGDSWTTAVDAPVWSAPDDLPSRRGRTAKIAVGGTAFVGIVLAVAIPLQRGPGDHPGSVPVPGQVLPPVAASTETSASSTAQPPTPTPTKSGARTTAPTRPAGPRTARPTPTPSASTWTTLTIAATKVMFPGDSVQTNRTRLLLQTNGDLVVIDEFQTVRWRSGTAGTGNRAVFQADGNFVVYNFIGTGWTSNTPGHDGAQLVLQADGDVCIVFNGSVIWSAGTAH
jgi:hypothetical protein